MGTSWTTGDALRARSDYRRSSGTSYAHTTATRAMPHADRKVHESVDPKRVNTLGEQIRECLDSDVHPNTVPVVCVFDETGSMGDGPRIIQEKLGSLKGVTLRVGLPDVQLCFGAYGDASYYDSRTPEVAPCQIGQFESGLEMEEWLNNLYLEGAGGGNGHETAGLALWFLANYTRLDSVDKRGKKGYIFVTGDEIAATVTRGEIQHYIGTSKLPQSDVPMEEVIRQVTEKFEVFFMLVNNHSAQRQGSHKYWTDLLGKDRVIVVENLENIAELIGSILAFEEGVVDDMDHVASVLSTEGSTSTDIAVVRTALSGYATSNRTVAATDVSGGISTSNTSAEML